MNYGRKTRILIIFFIIFGSSFGYLANNFLTMRFSANNSLKLRDLSIYQQLDEKELLKAQDDAGYYINSDYIASSTYSDYLGTTQSRRYSFLGNNTLEVITDYTPCLFSYSQDIETQFRYLSIDGTGTPLNYFDLSVTSQNFRKQWLDASLSSFHSMNFTWYNSIFTITTSQSIPLHLSIPKIFIKPSVVHQNTMVFPGFFQEYSGNNGYWEFFDEFQLNDNSSDSIDFTLYPYNADVIQSSTSETYKYTFTLFFSLPEIPSEDQQPIDGDLNPFAKFFNPQNPLFIVSIVFFIVIAIGVVLAMTSEEYRQFLIQWVAPRRNRHNLTMEEIFENENRMKIIESILNYPGIHYNQLRRATDIQGGQLRWHLDVLLSYGVIKSKPVGQYVLYYPVHKKNPISEDDLAVVKSASTLNILNIIRYSPGITASKIAKITDMRRNSVKYHIDKLLERDIIYFKQKGRQKNLFYNRDNDLMDDYDLDHRIKR